MGQPAAQRRSTTSIALRLRTRGELLQTGELSALRASAHALRARSSPGSHAHAASLALPCPPVLQVLRPALLVAAQPEGACQEAPSCSLHPPACGSTSTGRPPTHCQHPPSTQNRVSIAAGQIGWALTISHACCCRRHTAAVIGAASLEPHTTALLCRFARCFLRNLTIAQQALAEPQTQHQAAAVTRRQ